MSVKIQPASVIKARLGIESGGKAHTFFTNKCAQAMDKYVPFDTGTLAETVSIETDAITYVQPYARYVYYGISKNGNALNYHTDKHELATSYWDKHMWTAEGNDIVRQVQKYVNGGGK